MTSVLPHIKTIASENAYFVTIAANGLATDGSLAVELNTGNRILSSRVASGTNVTAANVSFSTAVWSSQGTTSTLVNKSGKMLRDMGKTIVSSLRTFRKVQAVSASANNTPAGGAAVGGSATHAGEEYLTGYIEVVGGLGSGFASDALPAAVARMG